MTLADIQKAILSLNSIEDLKAAQTTIGVRWRQIQTQKAAVAMVGFRVGDAVKLKMRGGKVMICRIMTLNQKTATVQKIEVGEGGAEMEVAMSWRASPTLLTKATDEEVASWKEENIVRPVSATLRQVMSPSR